MTSDLFDGSPTVGSHDTKHNHEEHQARIFELEQRLAIAEAQLAAKRDEESRKFKWGRVGKFFRKIIQPMVNTVTNLINSISRLLNSIAKLKVVYA